MDNLQFQFGQSLKPKSNQPIRDYLHTNFSKFLLTKVLGFDIEKISTAIVVFEGDAETVARQHTTIQKIAKKHNGVDGGEENGKRGYFLTYMIAYMRDVTFNYYFLCESFETSVPWSNVILLCNNVRNRVLSAAKARHIMTPPFICARVTQVYDTGACIYFYLAFVYKGVSDPLKKYLEIEEEAREEILKCGGSVSHHHGIGKLRKCFMTETVSPIGILALKALKEKLDPKNIFGSGNLIPLDDEHTSIHPNLTASLDSNQTQQTTSSQLPAKL